MIANYRLVDYLTADYRVVVNRLRVLVRRTQAVDWILDQLADVAGEFGVITDQGYRQSAGAVMLALLDFLSPLRDDARYRAFANAIQTRMKVYGLTPSRCRYYPPVKPIDERVVVSMRQHAPDFGDRDVDDSIVS